ncbi:MAG: putative pyridoxal-dependent aspartate 1-decarboxylase [Gammaproteobacteria bacterium]|nr:putative pyridoxal-dependent aspartate 1-decarboxylase [Gammaproteobacteria bacterium]
MDDDNDRRAEANLDHLLRLFTVPETRGSTLARIEQEVTENLAGFLRDRVVATERDLAELETDFADTRLPEHPTFVSDQADFLLEKVVAESVHTAAPGFVGHMTTALPYFMLPLAKLLAGLNQNLVKTETSKAFTPLERQVLGMLHRLVYARDDTFYATHLHDAERALGAFGSGGTVANITALWVARNRAFPADGGFPGIARAGFAAALAHHDCRGAVVLVSARGHYSLGKAADLLGLGRDQVVAIPTDREDRVRPELVAAACRERQARGERVMAIVGVAGTTETGRVDPLGALADVAAEHGAHFHVDAAWGGPTLFSRREAGKLAGIERADSVTLDAHKQLYVPLGCGAALFRDPAALNAVEHHAAYVIRAGSRDLGSRTLEGSRPGMALLVHSGLRVFGRQGYALLIERGIDLAHHFAGLLRAAPDFELVTAPELNILTYRYAPPWFQEAWTNGDAARRGVLDTGLNGVIAELQRRQRARGRSFVSRTTLEFEDRPVPLVVFRVVLANPLTTGAILDAMLDEQRALAAEPGVAEQLDALRGEAGAGEGGPSDATDSLSG